MNDLEKRIQKLEDIEAIKSLMGKYYRCLDCKLWEELKTCFSPNATTSYAEGKYSFEGPDKIVGFFESVMGPDDQISQHQGHTPEIHILSDKEAKANWYLQDYLYSVKSAMNLRGTAIYDITYEKVDGKWQILEIGYKRIFEEVWPRQDIKGIRYTDLGKELHEVGFYNKEQ